MDEIVPLKRLCGDSQFMRFVPSGVDQCGDFCLRFFLTVVIHRPVNILVFTGPFTVTTADIRMDAGQKNLPPLVATADVREGKVFPRQLIFCQIGLESDFLEADRLFFRMYDEINRSPVFIPAH